MDRENQESMEEIQLRILRITDDLRIIQSELNCAAMQAPTDPELLEALSSPSQMESLNVLKSVVDQMRHFLWFYMQVVTSDSEMGEKFVELGLDALAHAAQQNGQQRVQRQFALAGERVGEIGMPRQIAELAGMQVFGKGEEQLFQHGG